LLLIEVARRLSACVREMDTVVEHHCSASIGVVVFANHENTQAEILQWADSAMYQAKGAGRNTIRFHGASV
jgi:diguanylate cyclase (GGDEF)-like protein